MNWIWLGRQVARVIFAFLVGIGTLIIAYMLGATGYDAGAPAALMTILYWSNNP